MADILTLHSPGSIPGIPGESHGPGVFLVDWDARTIEELVPQAEDVPPPQEEPPVAPQEEGA